MSQTLQKKLIQSGNGVDRPKKGDEVFIQYTGWLYDASATANQYRGNEFDSSRDRGDFKTKIGVGEVIQGWDEGVMEMTLGEKSVLTIPAHMAYGNRSFPGLIPPNSTLIFEVELKGIGTKKA